MGVRWEVERGNNYDDDVMMGVLSFSMGGCWSGKLSVFVVMFRVRMDTAGREAKREKETEKEKCIGTECNTYDVGGGVHHTHYPRSPFHHPSFILPNRHLVYHACISRPPTHTYIHQPCAYL